MADGSAGDDVCRRRYSTASSGPSGRLLIVDEGAGVRSAPFDPQRPALTSADATVLDNVYYDIETEAQGWLAVSASGTAVYAPGNPAKTSLVWVGRDGRIEPSGRKQDVYREVRISPDGTKAVVRVGLNLWVYDLQRGTSTPLTSGNDSNILPVWSLDGRRVLFASNRGGDWDIYSQPADGSRARGGVAQAAVRSVSLLVRARRNAALYRDRTEDRSRSVDAVAGRKAVALASHWVQ